MPASTACSEQGEDKASADEEASGIATGGSEGSGCSVELNDRMFYDYGLCTVCNEWPQEAPCIWCGEPALCSECFEGVVGGDRTICLSPGDPDNMFEPGGLQCTTCGGLWRTHAAQIRSLRRGGGDAQEATAAEQDSVQLPTGCIDHAAHHAIVSRMMQHFLRGFQEKHGADLTRANGHNI